MIIAIDGPAGSGKSSTARSVAQRLDALYIDTGAMYRAIALRAIDEGLIPEKDDFSELMGDVDVDLKPSPDGLRVLLDGKDVSDAIRTEEASSMSSRVSQRPEVRKRMVDLQRRLAHRHRDEGGKVVMEGRDIGTVVFPDADWKFFVTASPERRAERRALQMEGKGVEVDREELLSQIRERDNRDSTRTHSPLTQAPEAYLIDTTSCSFEEQVENVLAIIFGNAQD